MMTDTRGDFSHWHFEFSEAARLASELHAIQVRKGTRIPYISHLFAVAAIVLEHGGGRVAALAALLHDAPEDQGGHAVLSKIENQFGAEVATVVAECSDTFESPKPPWQLRKQAFIDSIPKLCSDSCLVIASDKLHNMLSIERELPTVGRDLWDRFRGGHDGSRWYYAQCLAALRGHIPPNLERELQIVFARVFPDGRDIP